MPRLESRRPTVVSMHRFSPYPRCWRATIAPFSPRGGTGNCRMKLYPGEAVHPATRWRAVEAVTEREVRAVIERKDNAAGIRLQTAI